MSSAAEDDTADDLSDTTEQVFSDTVTATSNTQQQSASSKLKVNVVVDAFYTKLELHVSRETTGRELFDQVANLLNVREVWFFGLKYKDSKGIDTWLKLKKKIFIQDIGKKRPVLFDFRAKFYPEEVAKELSYGVALRLFFEQVKEDVVQGELYCPIDSAVLLASYSLQQQYGNYNVILQPNGFLHQQHVLPKKLLSEFEFTMQQWEDKIVNFYKDHRDMTKDQVMMEYLRVCQDLEMYAVSYFAIKNKKGTELFLGVDALGLNVYEKDDKLKPKMGFPWDEIRSISFKDKRFTINPVDDKSPNFIFLVTKSRINKKILALCMGNHELFIRRRKVSPSQRSSTASNRISELDSRSSSKMSKVTEEASGEEQQSEVLEPNGQVYEQPHYQQVDIAQVYSQNYESEDATAVVLRSKTPSPQSPIMDDEIPANIVLERMESLRRSAAPVNEDNTHLYNSDPVTLYGYEELPLRPSSVAKRATISVSPKEQHKKSRPYSPTKDDGGRDSVDSPEIWDSIGKPSFKDPSECQIFDINVQTQDGQEEVVHYSTVQPKFSMHVIKEDPIPERRKYLPQNKDTYQKLVDLFEELSKHHSGKELEYQFSELVYGKAANKYTTLKHIRSGYAKDRIALFEAI